ncbi:branched-chain alpha-keto acid dehydrogenase subunit E2 [Metarhizobium album]|uniref:Dihydrolipoamide acetyltransferase component of pyruvate dehydrogenase complex n=1 Tax=Metarhizobium album TaxID=2182425 RepID=A0A2U2DR28_9HYPH|nr:dihydrolipoamide acetyltransferase family protein [Rhizobium album]PWE55679.1 branched-chain alpha-keto acid dehydrogenase subunit E2 [Rhizobium album]
MGVFSVKLPDVGEGIAEAELTEWHVKLGDMVREDDLLAAVMTDKATVEIPSAVTGKVIWLGATVGETVAIGSDIVRIEVEGEDDSELAVAEQAPPTVVEPEMVRQQERVKPAPVAAASEKEAPSPLGRTFAGAGPRRPEGEKPLAPPSVRLRAREAGIDLRRVRGSGPAGRITHDDLDAFQQQDDTARPSATPGADLSVTEIKMVGLRRKIAERMAEAKAHIPHITIVEEVDVSALEDLRTRMNAEGVAGRPKLTVLPFLIRAIVKAVKEQPALNAHYDDEAEIIRQFGGVHVGIASQTPNGLLVPVIRHAETLGLYAAAAELARVAEASRNGTARREELSGSTITISSLGPLGAVATTPIINRPEVAIVGVNKIAVRPHWDGQQFVPRKMMNLSSSFDHRVIDGWDAAIFVKRLKTLMEMPAMMFVGG